MADYDNVPPKKGPDMEAMRKTFEEFNKAMSQIGASWRAAIEGVGPVALTDPQRKLEIEVTEEEAQTIWALRNGTARVVPVTRKHQP